MTLLEAEPDILRRVADGGTIRDDRELCVIASATDRMRTALRDYHRQRLTGKFEAVPAGETFIPIIESVNKPNRKETR